MKKSTKMVATLSASALMMIAGSAVSFAATAGWNAVGDTWQYLNSRGEAVTDAWKQSGDLSYYLDSDGYLTKDKLIQVNDDYYYMNADGAMVKNSWKYLTSDDDDEARWYYFGSDGKAYRSKSSTLGSLKTINDKKYAFDEDGKMLYGWIAKDNLEIADDDDKETWKSATYYFGDAQDGAAAIGWKQIAVDDDDNEDSDFDGTYWFYFDSNGKKTTSAKKKINGITYSFNTTDGHMLTGWAATDSNIATAGNDIKHMDDSGTMAKNQWVWAIPAENYDRKDYDEDEYSWWYTDNTGKVIKNKVKKINSKKYAFDSIGRMQTGLVYVNNDVISIGDLDEISRADLLELQMNHVYYFSNDEEKDGSMKFGYQNIELDDDTYQFYFNTSSGEGQTGFISKIKKFTVSGIVLKADKDVDTYAGVSATGTKNSWTISSDFTDLVYGTDISTDGSYVLINTSGAVQTNRKNIKTDNDLYISTDADGYVTYVGTEKQ